MHSKDAEPDKLEPNTDTATSALVAERHELRRHYRHLRTTLPDHIRQAAEQSICQTLLTLESVTGRVAAYVASNGEPNLTHWMKHTSSRIFLPRVEGESMSFHAWHPETPLHPNRWGIGEPNAESPQAIAKDLQVVLLPLVAFDHQGHRLGMGGGYYDRFLAAKETHPKRIGVAFDCQAHQNLPAQPWDIPLEAVVTESGIHHFEPTQTTN